MHQPDGKLLAEMARGARLLFENAEALYNEAETLGTRGHFARALFLHQISMEECSKVDMLGSAAVGMLMGHPVDLEALSKRMAQHKVKNLNNAYLGSPVTEGEREARRSGDLKAARDLFRRQQEAFHQELNHNKNGALYVDYVDRRFVGPSERIDETLAAQTQHLNAFFLQHGALHVRLLERFIAEPDVIDARLTAIVESFQELVGVTPSEREGRWMEVLEKLATAISEERP